MQFSSTAFSASPTTDSISTVLSSLPAPSNVFNPLQCLPNPVHTSTESSSATPVSNSRQKPKSNSRKSNYHDIDGFSEFYTPFTMKFLHLNVNSIKKYKDELISTFPDVDCFSLNETKLNPSVASFSFPGFNIFRLDRSANGGGVLVAIKQIFQSVLIEKGFVTDNEYVIIECKRKKQETFNHCFNLCSTSKSRLFRSPYQNLTI